jgi:enoyl-[acyl-carrier protein] reductase I
MKNLQGKRALVFGVANKRSIAYGIAKSLREYGAEIVLSIQNERLRDKLTSSCADLGNPEMIICDVADHLQLDRLFSRLDKIDILIHSLAFASTQALEKSLLETQAEDYLEAMKISSFSLIELTRRAVPIMKNGGSIVTMTYLGAQRVMSGYGLMGPVKASLEANVKYLAAECGPRGIRINAISAGPIKTLASSVFPHFNQVLELTEAKTPLRKNITLEDVGELACFLASSSSASVTGCVYHLDSGAHILGA